MFLKLTLVQLLVQPVVQVFLLYEIGHLHFQFVVELFEGELVTNLHLVAERLNRDLQLCFIDKLLLDGQVVLLHVNLHFSQKFLDLHQVT